MADEEATGLIAQGALPERFDRPAGERRERQATNHDWLQVESRIARIETHLEYVATKEMLKQAAVDREKTRGEIREVRIEVQAVRVEVQAVRTDMQKNSKNMLIFLITTGIAWVAAVVALIGAIVEWY